MTRICDFCSSGDAPRWRYPCHDFRMPVAPGAAPQESSGSWLACDICHLLIEGGRIDQVKQRAVQTFVTRQHVNAEILPAVQNHVNRWHSLFFANRTGPAVPLEMPTLSENR